MQLKELHKLHSELMEMGNSKEDWNALNSGLKRHELACRELNVLSLPCMIAITHSNFLCFQYFIWSILLHMEV
jgi:hypothetical protein